MQTKYVIKFTNDNTYLGFNEKTDIDQAFLFSSEKEALSICLLEKLCKNFDEIDIVPRA